MVVIILRNLLILLIELHPHGAATLWVSDIASIKMAVIRMQHIAAGRLNKWLTWELLALLAILIQLVYLFLFGPPFLLNFIWETRAGFADFNFTIIQSHSYWYELWGFIHHAQAPVVWVLWSMAVIQTFVPASTGDFVYVFPVSIHMEVNVTLSTLLIFAYRCQNFMDFYWL